MHFQAVVGDVPIQDVCYSPSTRNLMICLADTCDRYCWTSRGISENKEENYIMNYIMNGLVFVYIKLDEKCQETEVNFVPSTFKTFLKATVKRQQLIVCW